MRLYSPDPDPQEELNVWTAFTDLMSNSFMILSLFMLILLLQSMTEMTDESQLREIRELKQKLKILSSPPLWVFKDSDRDDQGRPLRFATGKADIPPALNDFIRNEVAADIRKKIQENQTIYENYIIQVVGHTDGQKITQSSSNLDENLEKIAADKKPASTLTEGSNADLGLMRAIAVVKLLEKELPKWKKFRAYSAAQLYLSSGEYAPIQRQDNPTRRRIEISLIPPPADQEQER
jgi:hypothetical protein